MSLEGAKLICLNADDDGQFETMSANGKNFKFGYYMDCDVVLEHPDAMGLHCVINCDAFGRVTIENRCIDKPITLDGKTLVKMRPLLHNTEICILGKKYLWQFDGNPEHRGFQMEDKNDFTTPSKQMKKPQQPPNSEPSRKWRKPLQTRLTIHSFAYCIKAGESPKDVETTTDENKPLNIHEQVIDADIVQNKRFSSSPPPPPENISDFIDLNTPKIGQRSFSRRDLPLSCCKLSETVITSYSPRETGIRQEKSFAIVQSPLTARKVKIADVSLEPFHHIVSPQTIQNYRPSMHLIDLITPKKPIAPASSPSRTLLKSTHKKNLPKGTSPQTPQKLKKITELSTPGSSSTVYSVRSTDDESVIILSDDCSGSPSPIAKTPPRARTPTSLMKRAILSSAKKVAINKKLLNLTGSKQTLTPPVTSNSRTAVRFQSQSTPQRKSLGRVPSSADSLSAGKPRRNLVTSTPFRQRAEIVSSSSSRRSLIINSQSSGKKESRNSLMLKQALSMTPTTSSMTETRKSVSCMKSQNKPRKSVSFLQHVEKEEQANADEVEKAEDELNHTFTIKEDNKNDIKSDQVATSYRKDATFSPEKEKCQEGQEASKYIFQSKETLYSEKLSSQRLSTTPAFISGCKSSSKTDSVEVTSSVGKLTGSVVLHSAAKSKHQTSLETDAELTHSLSIVSQVGIISDNQRQVDTEFHEDLIANKNTDPQSSNSSKNVSKINESISGKHVDTDYDFDGADEIFKTPKAKNIMILSSPKSISLQKIASDSVELIHPTEFDLSANLDDLFQTPQSEFITRRAEAATPATATPIETLSPEEAFDMLVGRPIVKKSYARKTPPKKQELPPLKISNDPTVPKTDIEEWIDSVNDLLEGHQDEEEMSYITATMDDISRDPLMAHSVARRSNAKVLDTPGDELQMTIKKETEEKENRSNPSVLKDPLETTNPRSLSPNISGIGLLDHTSESIFSETLALSDDSSLKETEKTVKLSDENEKTTLTNNQKQLNISQEDKARREIEAAFENFEKERKTLDEKRLASTPEAKKPSISKFAMRRTMGNQVFSDPTFDPNAIKEVQSEQKKQINTEEFGQSNEVTEILEKNKVNIKDHKRTLGTELVPEVKLGLQAAKAERELELAFENFEEQPEFSEQREAKTPEPKKVTIKDHRRTLGTALVPEVKLDLQAAKAERELELAFENFEEQPEFSEQREAKTPEPKKVTIKDHRTTLGTELVPEVKLGLQAAKAERELELAFENFEEQPEFSEQREAKTPEPKKVTIKDHRRTLGTALVPEVKLDLQAAKAERELELAFENFEEQPEFSEQREAKTPEPKKVTIKDHRTTLGTELVPEVKLGLQAAKAERELELAFENFEEQPEFSEQREAKTPEPKKVTIKDHRRTLGTALVPEVKLDLQAAKAERELELAFENFEEQPEFSEQREAKTPEPKKVTIKDHRTTLGTELVPEVKLGLQAAKAERELELAFENFEEQPEFSEQREAKTPEPKKVTIKDHRRTLGTALVPEVKLDLQAAKAERELELAFENFEEQPEFTEQREVKTPEPKKRTIKDHRRTVGTALVPEVKLDLQAAKAERELKLAFENFEEQPEFSEQREAKTPEPKKVTIKDHRRTVGTALVPEVKLDLQAAKAERELELAFENFEEQPEFSEQREVKTPEPRKVTIKDHRRTLGTALVPEVKLDLQAAKAERELKLAFENFEEQPEFSEQREAKTPEPRKVTIKDHRRTLGTTLVPEVKLDLQAAKAERELELAFENFEEQPEFTEQREVKTPEPKKRTIKDHRRTVGTALVPEVKLDLQAAKAERELELAFENFEEQPEFTEQREVKTPEPKKRTIKDHRRTVGTALVPEVKLDLQAAKAERELELAFENFEEQPEFSEQREVKTPEPKKVTIKEHRRTLGTALVPEVKLDLQAAKAERELELAFENFEEQPEFSEQREVKTPEPKKVTIKDHRRTLGTALVPEVKLDLQAAKAERELKLAFENFEEQPEFSEQREAKTPEPRKVTIKDHRRTLGTTLVPEVKLDLQAAKAERELELAFENFEEQPEFTEQREVKTPEPKKRTVKDHRRTVGTALVPEVKLDLQAAKAERELELAFENFEEQPEFTEQREVKTPEPKKRTIKDHRRTVGTALVPEVKLDLQAAKAERELELAFENFEEQPEFSVQREAKTPEPKKVSIKDHRRTLGTALVPEVKLDLQAAKAERELELAFENFEEQPEFSEQREVKTPEPKKVTIKDHRRTLGTALVPEVKLDLQAAKAERELELAFENFEEQPEFSVQREAKTPEPKTIKDHRRTVGSALVVEATLDLQAAKAERELELAFEKFEEQPEFSEERIAKTPEPENSTETSLDHKIHEPSSNLLDDLNDKVVTAAKNSHKINRFQKDKSMQNKTIVYEQMELKNVKEGISANNEKQKVDKNPTTETIHSYENATSEDSIKTESQSEKSISARPLRRRRNTIDEDDQSKENPIGIGQQETNKTPSIRRTRKKTVENLDDFNSVATEKTNIIPQSKPQENLPQKRRTRQNSTDSVTNYTKSTRGPRKELKESNNEEEPSKTSSLRIDSTDVDSTEEEANQTSNNSRKKRIPKIASKIFETVLIETEPHHILESIDEEAINSESKIIKDIEAKSMISLRAEADEIISLSPITSRNRIRGRKAQLNVVHKESSKEANNFVTDNKCTNPVDSANNSIEIHKDDNSKKECVEKIVIIRDACESIPSTPQPLTSRGRRPSNTKESTDALVPCLRRTRKGSVQQDIEIQTVDKNEASLKKNVLPSKCNILKEDIKPGNDILGMEADDEDIVPSTPMETKTRRRQLSNKQKTFSKTSRKESSTLEQIEDINSMQGNAEATENENSIQVQEDVTHIKYSDGKNGTSYSVQSRISEDIQTKSPTVCDEKISPKQQVSRTEELIKNIESSPIQESITVPTSPFLSNTRGRRAVSKIHLDQDNATPKRRVGRPKKVAKKTDLRNECTDEGATRENVTQDGEGIVKVVETTSSESTKIFTSPKIENGTSDATQKHTSPQIPSNRRIGRSKAIKKTVIGSDCIRETPSKDENSDNDENNAKVVEVPFAEVIENQNGAPVDVELNIPLKTRGRRAAVKPENEVPVVKRGRKRAAEQICETQSLEEAENEEEGVKLNMLDCQVDSKKQDDNSGHVADAEKLMTPVPLKKRGRKAAIKIEPAAIIVSPNIVLKAHCTDETKSREDNLNDDIVKVVEAPSPNVFKSPEIQIRNETPADDETNKTSRTRLRRAAVKPENIVPAVKSVRKRVTEQISATEFTQGTDNHQEEVIEVNVQDSQLDLTNYEEKNKLDAVVELTMTPVPAKKRGRKAAIKIEPEVSKPAFVTPIRRAGRRDPVEMPILNAEKLGSLADDGENEGDATEEVAMNLLSSKTRGRKGVLDLIPPKSGIETSTPIRRGARRNISAKAKKSPESEKITSAVHEKQDNSKILLSPSKIDRNETQLTSKSEEQIESSTPIRRGGRTRVARTNVENAATEPKVDIPKSRGRKGNQKVEVVSSTKSNELVTYEDKTAPHSGLTPVKSEPHSTENSPAVQRTRQKRSAVQEEIMEKEDQFEENTDKTIFKKVTEALNDSDIPAKKRTRRAPVKLTEFVVSNLVKQVKTEVHDNKSDGSDTDVQKSRVSIKHGQPTVVELEDVESTQEESTPARKRGRRAIVKNDNHKESAPRRAVRQGKVKDEAAQNIENKNDSSCELLSVSDEDKSGERSTKKPIRKAEAFSGANSPSLPVAEEQETRSQNKLTRGREKVPLKNNSIQEYTLHTEEEQTASTTKPKSNRGRKPATKAEPEPEKEIVQDKTSNPEINSNTKLEISQNEDKKEVDQKPKRGRKAATAEPINNSPIATKTSPLAKKTTRGRKAAVKNTASESDDQSFQSDVQTRSAKKQDKDTKPAAKRRNLEILTKDDQQDTPSKRTRRKPNKLLS